MKYIIKIRAILSSLLLVSFIVVLVTGIGLFLAPVGKVAKDISWSFLGIDKWRLESLHTVSGFVLSGLVIIHLIINFKLFIRELKILFKR